MKILALNFYPASAGLVFSRDCMQSLYCRGACAWPTHGTADLKGEEDRLLIVMYNNMNYFILSCHNL